MEQRGDLIKRQHVQHSSIVADPATIARIAADLEDRGASYMPGSNWLLLDAEAAQAEPLEVLPDAFRATAVEERMRRSDQMLDLWIGPGQADCPLGSSASAYQPFLERHDPLSLWSPNVLDPVVAQKLFKADLGSILDLNLLYTYAPDRSPTYVVEVGGGYGRTAEAALNVFGDTVKWVLIDAVPGSLAFAPLYLRAACPSARVGSYYDGDSFDLDDFDCYVIPAWRFEELNEGRLYDVCVNIESFQEMLQPAVDAYLMLFDRIACDGAMIYISNAHDYVFKGRWNYPSTWMRRFCSNTPRSWSRDHPTEIFIRTPDDHGAVNAAIEAAYRFTLPAIPPVMPTGARADLDRVLRALRRRAGGLRARLAGLAC